jgi:putative membrane protein
MTSYLKNNWFSLAVYNIILIYIVGIVGISFSSEANQQLFLQLTPLSLILTIIHISFTHKKWDFKFISIAIFIFLFGFFIEVIGVKTEAIFGTYYYGKTLGYKLLDVPIIMGLNWLLLIYAIATSLHKIKSIWIYSILAATLMTSLDFLIEPIAIKLDFWQWQNNTVPLQNYLAWFILSFILFYIFRLTNGIIENRFSKIILIIQFVFFGMLNILLK